MKTALRKQGGYFKRHKRTSVLVKWFEHDVSYELPQLNANFRYRYNLSPYVTIMAYGLFLHKRWQNRFTVINSENYCKINV